MDDPRPTYRPRVDPNRLRQHLTQPSTTLAGTSPGTRAIKEPPSWPAFDSVSINRTVVSNDSQTLNRAINPAVAVPDGHAVQTIRVNTSDRSSWQQHGGNATAGASVQSVQLQQPDNRVAIAGTTVEPEVYETLKKVSPDLFKPEAEKVAEAAAAEADSAAAAAEAAAMNTPPRQLHRGEPHAVHQRSPG